MRTNGPNQTEEPLPLVVGLSGRVGSGKSSVADRLAGRWNCTKASFGDYLRTVATVRGLPPDDRQVLQALGEEAIAGGWPEFCSAVLTHAGWEPGSHLIVDGIRHTEAIGVLHELTRATPFVLVFLAADETLLTERLRERGRSDGLLGEIERHSTEAQTPVVLREAADIVLDASRPIDELVTEIERRVLGQIVHLRLPAPVPLGNRITGVGEEVSPAARTGGE